MKYLKHLLLIVLFASVALPVLGKAAYYGKLAMIKQAEVIAVVDISRVEPIKEKRGSWTYHEAASATVEQTLKGSLPKTVKLYGGEDFICAQVHYQPGRYLVFLRKDAELLIGTNWHLGVRKIEKDKVEWFAGDDKWEMKQLPLADVLTEIKKAVSEKVH